MGRETKNLVLRNGIFYFRLDVKQSNGKYKSIRRSLGTTDLRVALARARRIKRPVMTYKDMTPEELAAFARWYNNGKATLTKKQIEDLSDETKITEIQLKADYWLQNQEMNKLSDAELITQAATNLDKLYKSKSGTPETLAMRLKQSQASVAQHIGNKIALLDREGGDKLLGAVEEDFMFNKKLELSKNGLSVTDALGRDSFVISNMLPGANGAIYLPCQRAQRFEKITIGEMIDKMLKSKSVEVAGSTRHKNISSVNQLLAPKNISLEDDFRVLCEPGVVEEMVETQYERVATEGLKADSVAYNVGVFRRLLEYAEKRYGKNYPNLNEIILDIPQQKRNTDDEEEKGYKPYQSFQLREIFSKKYDYFDLHPDVFVACLIVLWTGSRSNMTVTLKYEDVKQEDGIWYFHFRENDSDTTGKKHSKNAVSRRKVPLAKDLLDIGLPELLKKRKKHQKAKDSDFIFTRVEKNTSEPSNKFFTSFHEFLRDEFGLKPDRPRAREYSFHSFRGTVSSKFEDLSERNSVVNKIMGWKGKETRDQSYLRKNMPTLKAALDDVHWPEIDLNYWMPIMQKKFIEYTSGTGLRRKRRANMNLKQEMSCESKAI